MKNRHLLKIAMFAMSSGLPNLDIGIFDKYEFFKSIFKLSVIVVEIKPEILHLH